MPVQGFAKVSSDWLCLSVVAFKYPKEKHLPYNTHTHFVVYNKKYIYRTLFLSHFWHRAPKTLGIS